MGTMFMPLPSTAEIQYFEGVWARMFGAFTASGREKAGLSVEQAAILAGMEAQRWTALEAGDWLPSTREQFHRIAVALDIEWSTMARIVLMCRGAWGLS